MPRSSRPVLRMARPSGLKERLIGVFLLGVLFFTPPFLAVASGPTQLGDFPLLFVWLYGAWAVLIVILALVVERSDPDVG